MSETIIPDDPRFIGCPYDGPILEHFRGRYESVFVVLHPFIHPGTLDPSVFSPDTYPEAPTILARCRPVRWATVVADGGFLTLASLDIALRSYFLALCKPDKALVKRLESYLEQSGTIPPDGGIPSPFVDNALFGALPVLGHNHLLVSDEFGMTTKVCPVADLECGDVRPYAGCLSTPDWQVLLTTHWDSCSSFLCADRPTLERLVEATGLEGFFCNERTDVFWGCDTD